MFGSLRAFFMRHTTLSVVGVIVVVLGGWYLVAGRSGTDFQTMTVQPAPFREQVSVSGTVVAAHDVDLGTAASGRVQGVYAQVGDHVGAGKLLVQLENGDLRAGVEQRQAALEAQQAQLAQLQMGTRPEQLAVTQSTVASDQAALAQSESALVNAIQSAYTQADDATHNKVDQFLSNPRSAMPQLSFSTSDQQSAITLQGDRVATELMLSSWQNSVANLSSASDLSSAAAQAQQNLTQVSTLLLDANGALNAAITSSADSATIAGYITSVSTARTNINTALSALTSAVTAETAAASLLNKDEKNLALEEAGSTSEDITAQEAQVASAEADLANAQAQLDKTLIVAPFAGTITKMDAKTGAVISPTEPQISMISDGLFEIDCYVPEVEIAGLSVGDKATTTLDAYGVSVPFAAKVVSIDPAETVVSGVATYKTTLQFLAEDARIRAGMTASVTITAQEIANALVVPQAAVFQKNSQPTLQLFRNGQPVDVTVQTGTASTIGNVQILSGLSPGDAVILNPDTSR